MTFKSNGFFESDFLEIVFSKTLLKYYGIYLRLFKYCILQ